MYSLNLRLSTTSTRIESGLITPLQVSQKPLEDLAGSARILQKHILKLTNSSPIIYVKVRTNLQLCMDFCVCVIKLKFPHKNTQPPKMQQEKPVFYEVDKVIKKRQIEGQTCYLVKWKGYRLSESTWEPQAHLAHLKQDLQRLMNEQKKPPKKKKIKRVNRNREIRRSNGKKISEYLTQNHNHESLKTDHPPIEEAMVQDSLKPLKDEKENHQYSEVQILQKMKRTNSEETVFKILKKDQIFELTQTQTKILFASELSLFYEQKVRKIMLRENSF